MASERNPIDLLTYRGDCSVKAGVLLRAGDGGTNDSSTRMNP